MANLNYFCAEYESNIWLKVVCVSEISSRNTFHADCASSSLRTCAVSVCMPCSSLLLYAACSRISLCSQLSCLQMPRPQWTQFVSALSSLIGSGSGALLAVSNCSLPLCVTRLILRLPPPVNSNPCPSLSRSLSVNCN